MGTYLAAHLAPGAHVLTDRKVPGDSEANIDHVVVASTGVWIIDSKKWTGEIRYRSPGFPSTDPRRYLTVDGKDRTSEIPKIYRLVIPVAQVIEDGNVTVHPVLAFVEAMWGIKEGLHFKRGKGPYEHEGVLISGGHHFIELINASGPLTPDAVEALWRRLDAAMPPR
ncbi:MAG: NERD domain-containing protein [Acidobacteria bacterium]|nr:NERD domain-containing protein [Acidobacteriota bacterium]